VFQEAENSTISRQSAHEGCMVVSPMHRPPLCPEEIFLVLISVRGWVKPRAVGDKILDPLCNKQCSAVAQVVEELRYKPKDSGFGSRWGHWDFLWQSFRAHYNCHGILFLKCWIPTNEQTERANPPPLGRITHTDRQTYLLQQYSLPDVRFLRTVN
jgi:hypothetical protein